ncbi:MAG: putative DNA binding domain-containing protein, partial [Candidatus Aminicenantes bacterium]|nr:putative DNA binding domain-containing protein [Candidatus Aminicenantes bacterium]
MKKEELEQVLQEGEGQFVEFKENFDNSLAKEITAFANASGGKIFLGVNDAGKIKGLSTTNKLKSQVIDTGQNCDPEIFLSVEVIDNILMINVPEGNNKPYQCSKGFYLRLGANSQKLKRDKILDFCIKENKIRFDELVCPDFDFKDFDDDKFEYYLLLAGVTKILGRDNILRNLKILNNKGMSNAGVLFFAKKPYKYISASKIRCVHFKGDERIDILDKKEVDKGVIGNIEFAINYIEERVPVRFEIKGGRRIEHPQFPVDVYREAIVNAVIHRDYFENGEVAVEKLSNGIRINNPGGLIASFPMSEFGKLSWPRNRLLADLLSKTIFMEKVGTGIKRMEKLCMENSNAFEIRLLQTHFIIEMESPPRWSSAAGIKDGIKGGIKDGIKLKKNQREILRWVLKERHITQEALVEKVGISARSIEKNIAELKEKGILKRVGSRKSGYWEVESNKIGALKSYTGDGIKDGIKGGIKDGIKLKKNQREILRWVLKERHITQEALVKKVGISAR